MVGSFLGCCPRAASGHTAAALPSVTTNSRRWMWVAIDPPVGVMPMQRRGRYHALPKGRTMLLRCESLEPPMSEVGHELKGSARAYRVRFAPVSGPIADILDRQLPARRRLMHGGRLAFSRLPCLCVAGTM